MDDLTTLAPLCVCCGGGDHAACDCPYSTGHDRAMMRLGATLLVNISIPNDYGQNIFLDFARALGLIDEGEG